MSQQLVLSDDQVAAITQAPSEVIARDGRGKPIAVLSRIPDDPHFTPEEIVDALRRIGEPGPRRTTAEVLAQLRAGRRH